MSEHHGPYVVEQQPGKVAWCSCGASEKQPYCDGAHSRKNLGMKPVIVEITEAKKVAWCGCRKSSKVPYCDGTHSKIKA